MLFSDESVANYINAHFEPAWESVAPVPIVRVEFGDRTQTRTFGGNVVTWVCNPDGYVLDLAPRIHAPRAYLQRLADFVELARKLDVPNSSSLQAMLQEHHEAQLERPSPVLPVEPEPEAARRMGNWQAILTDTRRTEQDLRPRVHRKLMSSELTTPDDLKHWAYHDLMHLDLHDPYLGLGEGLFADYPFAAEDAQAN